ncbi:O-antigen ligase family protein [Alphaproteobacteria bacterium]|nr:O-antigen ligase family protein [Alphaproteobacteria bacterium]
MQPYIELKEKNLIVANRALLLLLLIALPFDNALFHFTSFLLLFTFSLSVFTTGAKPLVASFKNVENQNRAFGVIILVMALSNMVNGQGTEAWRNLLIFLTRYWGLFLMLCYFWTCGVITMRFLSLAFASSLCVQFFPFLPSLLEGLIFSTRLHGFTSNSNVFGLYSGLGVLFASFLALQPGKINYPQLISSLTFLTLSLTLLLASGNRGGWVAVLCALAIFFLLQFRNRPFLIITIFSICGLITFIVFSNFSVPMERLNLLISGYSSQREEVWGNVLAMVIERPLLGYGLHTREILSASEYIYSEHNIFLSVLVALGFSGFIAYMFLLFLILGAGLKNHNYYGLILMIFLFSIGMFGFDFYHDNHFMVIFIITSSFCVSQKIDTTKWLPKKGS